MANKTHKMEISFWEKNGEIHISFGKQSINENTGITTINDKENSQRCHKHLYNQLKNILKHYNKWPRNRLSTISLMY